MTASTESIIQTVSKANAEAEGANAKAIATAIMLLDDAARILTATGNAEIAAKARTAGDAADKVLTDRG